MISEFHATRRYRGLPTRWLWLALSLLIVSLSSPAAQASGGRLHIHVIRDRLTLAVTKYPQVYLYGRIDKDAPQRFARLVKSGQVVPGSDVYLSSRDGDIAAGMALGRLFRQGGMATHLSAPRKTFPGATNTRTAVCVDACAYAFFGGRYRWAPSGSDRIGLTPPARKGPATDASLLSAEVTSYLKEMRVDLAAFAPAFNASPGAVVWLAPDRLTAAGVVNNGEQVPTAIYDVASATPTLDLRQVDRKGEHRLTVACHPGHTIVTGYEKVGARRARQIAARDARSYFELNGKTVLSSEDGVSAEGDQLVVRRDYPPADLVDLLFAGSVGVWVTGRSNAFRDGFTVNPWPLRDQLKVFYYACWRAAPWPSRTKPPG